MDVFVGRETAQAAGVNIGLATLDIGQFFEASAVPIAPAAAPAVPTAEIRSFLDLLLNTAIAEAPEPSEVLVEFEDAVAPEQQPVLVPPPLFLPVTPAAPEMRREQAEQAQNDAAVQPPVLSFEVVRPPQPQMPTQQVEPRPSVLPVRRQQHEPVVRPSSELKQIPQQPTAPVAFRLKIEAAPKTPDAAPVLPAPDPLPVAGPEPRRQQDTPIAARQELPPPPASDKPDRPSAPPPAVPRTRVAEELKPEQPAQPSAEQQREVPHPEQGRPAPQPSPEPPPRVRPAAPKAEPQAPPVSEPAAVEPARPKTEAPARIREFVVQVPVEAGRKVDVHLVERGNSVRVTVRTSSADMSEALRSELGELVRSITDKGFRIEAWTPPETYPAREVEALSGSVSTSLDPGRSGSDAESRSQRFDGGEGEQHQRRARRQWLEQFEAKLEKE